MQPNITESRESRVKLPVGVVLRDTFSIPGQHMREFLKPLALPGLALAVLMQGWQFVDARTPALVDWGLYAVYTLLFSVFAVVCHRLVLFGPSPETIAPRLRWGLRESRFLGWGIGVWLIFSVTRLVSLTLIVNVFYSLSSLVSDGASRDHDHTVFRSADYISYVIGAYALARVALVLPATAVDDKLGLRGAWRLSARNGWRLAIIVSLLPFVLSYALDLVSRENATVVEVILITLLSLITLMLGIIALSLSYRELRVDGTEAESGRVQSNA
jgi:hypothetical protein